MRNMFKATVAASVALLLVGGSVAGAARMVTGKTIRNSSITGADVKNRSLTPADFRGSVQGPAGPAGAPGAQGPAGPQGPQGPAGIASVTTVRGGRVSVPPGEVEGANAYCPAGSVVVGTGFFSGIGSVGFVERFGNSVGIGVINDTSVWIEIEASAICATGSGVQALSARSASESSFAPRLAALRAARG